MPKARRVTMQDVAECAGVGVATVDRVLNNRAAVRPATASRVLQAAEELGFYGSSLIRQRIAELAPTRRLGFILQKESKAFYQSLAEAIRDAAAALSEIRASVEISFVESLSPGALSAELARMAGRCDAVAVVSVDHPLVSATVADCARRGIPVFAMLSPLSEPTLQGYVGIDGRKAGRTAGWAMARLVRADAEIGVLVGSHRYLGHEALEVGFRSYMREFRPAARLRDSIVYLDDRAVAYEAASELLHRCPDMGGLYHCGGGATGVIRALREAGRGMDVAYVCHERSPATTEGLLDGTVDLVLATPVDALAERVAGNMQAGLLARDVPSKMLDFQIFTPENL